MAALEDTNPYELHPQPRQHAEPGHVHRFVQRGYQLKCIYCDAVELFVLREENAALHKRVQALLEAMLEIYRLKPRAPGASYGGLPSAREIASRQIALSQWRDDK